MPSFCARCGNGSLYRDDNGNNCWACIATTKRPGEDNKVDGRGKLIDRHTKAALVDLRSALTHRNITRERAYQLVQELKNLYETIPLAEQDPLVHVAFSKIDNNHRNCIIDRTQPPGLQFIPKDPNNQFIRLFSDVTFGSDWEGPFVPSGRQFVLRPPPTETKSPQHTISGPLENSPAISTPPTELPRFCVCGNGPLYYYKGSDCYSCMKTS